MANSPPMPPPGGGMPPPPMSLPAAQEVSSTAPQATENGGFSVDMKAGAEPEAPGRPDEEQSVGGFTVPTPNTTKLESPGTQNELQSASVSQPTEPEPSGENGEEMVDGFAVPKPKQEFAPPPVNSAFANLEADFFAMPKPKSSKGKSKGKAPSPKEDTTPAPSTASVPPPAPSADVSSPPTLPPPVSTGERLDAADTYASPSPGLGSLPPPAALGGLPPPNGSSLPPVVGVTPPPAVGVTPPIAGLPPPNASVLPPTPNESSLVPPADPLTETKPRSNSGVRFDKADVVRYDEDTGQLRHSVPTNPIDLSRGQSAEAQEGMDQPLLATRDVGADGLPEGFSAFHGFTPTPGFQLGRWEYICVDPTGLRLRRTIKYAKTEKTGSQLHFGQKFLVCERGDEGSMRWLCLADGQGWAFERTNRRRASEITYEELDPELAGTKFMVCPTYGSPVALALAPYLHSGNAFNTVMPGTLVDITQKASSIVQAKNGKGDQKRSFVKIYNSDIEGWIPEFGDDSMQKMVVEYKFEPAGDSAWISIMGKDVKLWPSPGLCGAKFATGKAAAGDIFPVEEKCTAGETTFYRLPDKNWVSDRTEKNQKSCDLVTREEHWWQYSCIDKDGTAIRHAPTRSTNMNTGKALKHRQRVCCSEIVKFPDGDTFLHIEPPLDGWVPLTKLGGAKKFQALHAMPPRTGKGKGKGKGKAMMPQVLPGPQPQMPAPPVYYGQAPQGVMGDFGIAGGRGSVSTPAPARASITIQVDTTSFMVNTAQPQAIPAGPRDFGI